MNAPIYDYYRANYQPSQQVQSNAISDKKASNVQISPASSAQVNQATSAQVGQGTNFQAGQGTSAQASQPSCPANGAATPVKQAASASAAGTTPSSAPAMAANAAPMETITQSAAMSAANQNHPKLAELQKIVQQLYVAQAQVQLEANEIQRAQAIAGAAQQALEEASNNVRVIQAALHAAQETVAGCALRAQTAQLQLAAHDQLLFIARQRVDALSAQMVGLQAEEGIGEPKIIVDLPALLAKLKEPLPENQKPSPVPSILGGNSGPPAASPHRSSMTAQMPVTYQNFQAQQTPEVVDPNKFFEQLRAWNEQHTRNTEAIDEKKQNLEESMAFDEYGINELEESPESSLTEETKMRGNVDASNSPKVSELSDDDIKTLVDFIISTEQKKNSDSLDDNLYVEDVAKHTENKKYIDDFLNSIQNSAVQAIHSNVPRSNNVRSSKMDPKMMERLLTLHESLFHPATKQAFYSNAEQLNTVDLNDKDPETDSGFPEESNEIESGTY